MDFTLQNGVLLWGIDNALAKGNFEAGIDDEPYLTDDIGKPIFVLNKDDGGFPHTINNIQVNNSQQFCSKLGELGFFKKGSGGTVGATAIASLGVIQGILFSHGTHRISTTAGSMLYTLNGIDRIRDDNVPALNYDLTATELQYPTINPYLFYNGSMWELGVSEFEISEQETYLSYTSIGIGSTIHESGDDLILNSSTIGLLKGLDTTLSGLLAQRTRGLRIDGGEFIGKNDALQLFIAAGNAYGMCIDYNGFNGLAAKKSFNGKQYLDTFGIMYSTGAIDNLIVTLSSFNQYEDSSSIGTLTTGLTGSYYAWRLFVTLNGNLFIQAPQRELTAALGYTNLESAKLAYITGDLNEPGRDMTGFGQRYNPLLAVEIGAIVGKGNVTRLDNQADVLKFVEKRETTSSGGVTPIIQTALQTPTTNDSPYQAFTNAQTTFNKIGSDINSINAKTLNSTHLGYLTDSATSSQQVPAQTVGQNQLIPFDTNNVNTFSLSGNKLIATIDGIYSFNAILILQERVTGLTNARLRVSVILTVKRSGLLIVEQNAECYFRQINSVQVSEIKMVLSCMQILVGDEIYVNYKVTGVDTQKNGYIFLLKNYSISVNKFELS